MDKKIETDTGLNAKSKILYVEILRIFCIVFVIFNHTSSLGYVYFLSFDAGTLPYWFYMFFSVIVGVSVPVFFMISGMLLLGRSESIGYIWKKRISKYAVILVLFSLFSYALANRFDLRELSAKQFLLKLYSDKVIIPYWFLYAYLAFLILLPFIRKIARNISEKEFVYILAIYFVFVTSVQILQYRLSGGTVTLNADLNPSILCNTIIFYPVIGYYLGTVLKKVTNKMLIIAFVLFVISVTVTMLITDYRLELTGEFTEENVNAFMNCARPFQAIFVFLTARKLFENRKLPALAEKVISYAGGCVFGIYLIEHAFREELYSIYYTLCTKTDSFLAIWLYVLLIFLICLVQVAAFRYIVGYFRKTTAKHK